MTAWADRLGFVFVVLSEHHGSADGDLPSPLTSTRRVPALLRDPAPEAAAVGCGARACMVSWHARPR